MCHDLDPSCLQVKDGNYLVNNTCVHYFQCADGYRKDFACPGNTYFDIKTGFCQSEKPVGCTGTVFSLVQFLIMHFFNAMFNYKRIPF